MSLSNLRNKNDMIAVVNKVCRCSWSCSAVTESTRSIWSYLARTFSLSLSLSTLRDDLSQCHHRKHILVASELPETQTKRCNVNVRETDLEKCCERQINEWLNKWPIFRSAYIYSKMGSFDRFEKNVVIRFINRWQSGVILKRLHWCSWS